MAQTDASAWDNAAEVALLQSTSTYRPLGMNRHFHMISILRALGSLPNRREALDLKVGRVWDKLGEFYDLDGLNEQEEGSDDEEEPFWIRNFDSHKEKLESNEAFRTRVVDGLDDEEFTLRPVAVFEPWIKERRLVSKDENGEKNVNIVPSTSEDDLSEEEQGANDAAPNADRNTSAAAPRRTTRKRAHAEEDSADLQKDAQQTSVSTRAGKRRRGAKVEEEKESADTPSSRPITTRRQQRQIEERESVDADDGDDVASRPSRGAATRRQSAKSQASSAGASPSSAQRTTRPRRS